MGVSLEGRLPGGGSTPAFLTVTSGQSGRPSETLWQGLGTAESTLQDSEAQGGQDCPLPS